MDPSHLITPPRAHPSGTGNSLDDHHHQRKQPQNMLHEPWFIVLISIVLLLFSFTATVAMIIFRRRHQITKEVGHLNGNLYISFSFGAHTHTHPHNDSQRPYQTHQILFIVFTAFFLLCRILSKPFSARCQCKWYHRIEYKWQRKSVDWSGMACRWHRQGFRTERNKTFGQFE